MTTFTVMTSWQERTPSNHRFSDKSKTFRDVVATDIIDAKNKCLAELSDKYNAVVKCVWYNT